MPGNWLIPVAALVYDLAIPNGWQIEMGKHVLLALLALAIVGEALETLAGAMGVAKKGGSRRGAFGALVGSMIGGIAGAAIGIPIPVVGSIIGLIVFAAIGALVGAVIVESTLGKSFSESVDIGLAAMWGRILGSIAKTLAGGIMVGVVVAGLFI